MFVNIFTSGTNVQRLTKCTDGVDGVLYTAYAQLEKTEPGIVRREFFASNVTGIISEIEALPVETKPSWIKIWERPQSNRKFISTLLKALIGDESLHPEMNLSEMAKTNVNCFMLLVNSSKAGMEGIAKIAEEQIPNWHIKLLNGDYTTNRLAENETIIEINRAKLQGKQGVIIIANQMGSRSYSIPEIQASVIAYDRGSTDATMQKVSRCLTPTRIGHELYAGGHKTTGLIVDLSFDPNRNENIERLIIDEAIMIQRSGDAEDFTNALRYVLNAVDLFKFRYGNVVEVNEEDMFTLLSERGNLLRVADATVDIQSALSSGLFEILEQVNTGGEKTSNKPILGDGVKNRIIEQGYKAVKNSKDPAVKQLEEIINNATRMLNESSTDVYWISDTGGDSFRDCLTAVSKNKKTAEEFKSYYGVTTEQVIKLLDCGTLNEPVLDTLVQLSKPKPGSKIF